MISTVCIFSAVTALSLFLFGIAAAWGRSWPEIPYCLSDFYYVFGSRELFSRWFLVITILLIPPLMFLVSQWWIPLLLVVGCVGVGLAPDFKNSKNQYKVHMAGALLAMGSSQWIFSLWPWSFLGWSVFGLWALGYGIHQRIHHKGKCSGKEEIEEIFEREDWLWWMEFSMFVGIFLFIFNGLICV